MLEATKKLAEAASLLGTVNFAFPIVMGLSDAIISEVKAKGIDPGPYQQVRDEAVAAANRIVANDDAFNERHPRS